MLKPDTEPLNVITSQFLMSGFIFALKELQTFGFILVIIPVGLPLPSPEDRSVIITYLNYDHTVKETNGNH